MKNAVQLITYADRLGGGTLKDLNALLTGPLDGLFGAVHILPFFDPIDGSDAGFDPIDHTHVDPRLGDWADIAAIASHTEVMADVIVNHMSIHSPQFKDYSARGASSPADGLFLTLDHVFPQGASEHDLRQVYRPRPGPPFTPVTLANGAKRLLWTTFTAEQVDIDVEHAQGRAYLDGILSTLARHGVRMIRLDAVGYAIKRPGTSCFMLPQTLSFIDDVTRTARSLGLEVLVEVHSHYLQQVAIAQRVDWVYDFALPPLLLHALFNEDATALAHWITERPTNAITVLDTHDGIGIIDIGAAADDRVGKPGLVSDDALDRLVEQIHINSGGQSREATGAAASNLDLYQVNCSFYDALGANDAAYLLARAVQFFLPGVPQVYYMGLLAGRNDMALLHQTGVGRDINRHHYQPGEVQRALALPVVQKLMGLIRLRNTHPAFQGQFDMLQGTSVHELSLRWTAGEHHAELKVDFRRPAHEIQASPVSA
jgi:sucrose phosphorylase